MDELLAQFLIEAPELAAQAGSDLLALENDAGNASLIDSAFRAVHTLKGSAALFDLGPMEGLLHAAEDQLGDVRSGKVALSSSMIGALLAVLTQCEVWLADIEARQALMPDAPDLANALKARLTTSRHGDAAGAMQGEPKRLRVTYRPDAEAYFQGDDPLAIIRTLPGLMDLSVSADGNPGPDYDPYRCTLRFEAICVAAEVDIRAVVRLVADQIQIEAAPEPRAPEPTPQDRGESGGVRHIRVDTRRLDALATQAEQLIVDKNALGQLLADAPSLTREELIAHLRSRHDALDRGALALHRSVMQARLTPLEPVFRRLQRSARDIAESLSKPVQILVAGQDVELDKAIVDGLHDPLLHLLRNALDHGIEATAERTVAGKSDRATVHLSARRQGNHVVVEIQDDGRGIDPARIRSIAVARSMIGADAAARLSDEEAFHLIFRPGFSTARDVTALSGRGVGMDAVRSAVAQLGGEVTLASRIGEGTTIALHLPLTLVLTALMVVSSGPERFAIPLDDIVEIVQLPVHDVSEVRLGRAFQWRSRPLPLLRLADLLGLDPPPATSTIRAVIIHAAGEPVGIEVDAVHHRLDTALRPMTGLLSALPGISGTTLLGDGRLLLALDLPRLIG